MRFLRQAREAIFGETFALPIGVAIILVLAIAVREVAPADWRHLGGPLLLGATLILLVVLVEGARPGQKPKRGSTP